MGDREVLTPPNVLNMPNGTFVIGKGDPVGIAIGKVTCIFILKYFFAAAVVLEILAL